MLEELLKLKYFQHDEEEPVYDRENRIAKNLKQIRLLEEELMSLTDTESIEELVKEITALKFNNRLLED